MGLNKLTILAAASSIVASWAFAQEREPDGRTDHFDTELWLVEHNACKVWNIIWNQNICLKFGDDGNTNDDERYFTQDGNPIDLSYEEWLSSLNIWTFQYLRPDENSNSHVLINSENGERIEIKLREWDRIEEVYGNHLLIRNSSSNRNSKWVTNLEWRELFSQNDIFMRWENGFTEIDISTLSDVEFEMLVWIIGSWFGARITYSIEYDHSLASETFFNYSNKESIIRFVWDNREGILDKFEKFSTYIQPLRIVKDNFDAIENVVGRLDWKALLEADDIWYTQDFLDEYFEAFSNIPGLVEAFWYSAPEITVSDDNIFWEEVDDETNSSNSDTSEKYRVVREIQFMYRRLENPITEIMIDWFLKEIESRSETQVISD